MKKLNKLKEDLSKLKLIDIEQGDNTVPLISKPTVIIFSDEIIERVTRNIRIEENSQLIVHNHNTHFHAAARGKDEYFWRQHRFCFQIAEANANKLIFIGIISKDVLMKKSSYNSPSSYSWAPPNQVYSNGNNQAGFKGYRNDTEVNDIMELIVDCDRRKIHLTNESTHHK
jgi:hypothetical protein